MTSASRLGEMLRSVRRVTEIDDKMRLAREGYSLLGILDHCDLESLSLWHAPKLAHAGG